MFEKIIYFLVSIFGALMSIGHFPQAYKIYKNKSSKDVSLITYSIFLVGSIIWLIYGIMINETPIIISFIIGVIGTSLVFFLILKYSKY